MLVLAIMVAGCSDPAVQPADPGNPADPEPSEALQGAGWLNSTFTTLQVPGGNIGVQGGGNCVFFSRPGFDITVDRILDGFVEATWTSPNPMLQEMGLFVHGETLDPGTHGTSPLRVELHNITAHPRTGIHAFLRGDPEPSVDAEVNMTLQWSITYHGKPGPEVHPGGCG